MGRAIVFCELVRRLLGKSSVALLLLVSLAASSCHRSASQEESILIYVAASTASLIADLAKDFEKESPVRVTLSSAASSALARQILAGHEPDLFLSAHPEWTAALERAGKTQAGSSRELYSNDLVLITREGEGFEVKFDGACDWQRSLAIGDPMAVPVGTYAREALVKLGWWESLKKHCVPSSDARAVVMNVLSGRCAAGVVYGSDVVGQKGLHVVARFPRRLDVRVRYTLTLINGASEFARSFMDFLQSDRALEKAKSLGFLPALPLASEGAKKVIVEEEAGSFDLSPLWLSLKVAFFCSLLSLVPGILLAWLLARREFPGRNLVDAICHLPLVVPPVVTGYLLLLCLAPASPLGAFLANSLGLELFDWKGAVLASAIMGFPLLLRSVRLSIELVDRRLEAAAATLGASPLRVFMTVTIPLAVPGIITGTLLCFARSLGEFGATISFVSNIEGKTTTLPLAIWRHSQVPGHEAETFRFLIISIVIAFAAILASAALAKRAERMLGRS